MARIVYTLLQTAVPMPFWAWLWSLDIKLPFAGYVFGLVLGIPFHNIRADKRRK